MPTPRANFAIAAYNGKIYCMGGEVLDKPGAYEIYRVVEVYDTVTSSWSTRTDIPFDGLGFQVHVIGGKIFALSGCDLFMYDPITDKWIQKNSMPRPDDLFVYADVYDVFSVELDGKITVFFKYFYGNNYWDNEMFKHKVMIYDTGTDVWREGKTFTETFFVRSVFVGATTGIFAPKNIYIVGVNNGPGRPVLSNWVYDPAENVWSTATDMSTYRDQFGVANVDDVLYVIGGKDAFDDVIFADNEQYVPLGYTGVVPVPGLSKPTILTLLALIVGLAVVTTGVILNMLLKQRSLKADK
jgi:N-acetylneuraminic acid mutarotase